MTATVLETTLEAALLLARDDVHVFPLPARSKAPRVRWRDVSTAEPGQIIYWLSGSDANYGVDCGKSRLLVLDEDEMGELERLAVDQGKPMPNTFTVRTAHGQHFYFRQPGGFGNRAPFKRNGYKIDVRGEGGYVVGPGSTHPSGAVYTLTDATSPAELPSWLLDLLVAPAVPEAMPVISSQGNVWEAYVDRTVAGALRDLAQLGDLPLGAQDGRGQGWDAGTFAAACQLVRAANSGSGYTLDRAHEDFMAHAPTDSDFSAEQLDHKWSSAVRAVGGGALTPQGSSGEDFGHVGVAGPSPEPERHLSAVPDSILTRFPRLDLAALLSPDRPEREWVLRGLIPAGASVALVAPAGVGKSLLLLALALDIARGRGDFAGLTIPKARRVLLVDMENTEDDYAERLRSLGVTPADLPELEERFIPINLPLLAPLDKPEGGRELEAILEAYEVATGDVVVLDSFQRVTEGPENDSDTARGYYRHTASMLKKLGLTVIRTDNTGKSPEKGSRGSSSKRDDVDLELLLTRDATHEGHLHLRPGKSRLPGIAPLVLERREDEDGRLHYTTASDPGRVKVAEAQGALDELGLPHDVSERVAVDALRGAGVKIVRSVLRDALKERKDRARDLSPVEE